MAKSKITWTDEVWNPVTGCDAVSPGCDNCYAKVMAKRLKAMGVKKYRNEFDVTCHQEVLDKPLRWTKPRRIFVNSMSDLFHHKVFEYDMKWTGCNYLDFWICYTKYDFLDAMLSVMERSSQHTFQILTKRPELMKKYFDLVHKHKIEYYNAFKNHELPERRTSPAALDAKKDAENPVRENIWLGVSAENQKFADKRISQLLQIPAAKRFVSCEPLLGEIKLNSAFLYKNHCNLAGDETTKGFDVIDWLIIGCESGQNRRPCNLDWVYSLVDQCQNAQVPVFVKQIELDGKVVNKIEQFPKDLQIQEFPV